MEWVKVRELRTSVYVFSFKCYACSRNQLVWNIEVVSFILVFFVLFGVCDWKYLRPNLCTHEITIV